MSDVPAAGATTRLRLRDAAITRFARDGFGAGLRDIAADAGVSAALVVRHFGSKDALRAECDEYVLATIRAAKRDVLTDDPGSTAFLAQLAALETFGPLVGYVVRSLQAGGPVARAFVEHVVADTLEYVAAGVGAGTIVPSRDEEARVRYLVGASCGQLLLEFSLNPPADPADPGAFLERYMQAVTLPALEVFTEGFLTTRRTLDAYLLWVGDPPETDEATPA